MTSWTGPGGIAARAAGAWWGIPTPKANLPQPHTTTLLTKKGPPCGPALGISQPLAACPPRERVEWAAYVEAGQVLPASLLVGREERRGLARALGLTVGAEREDHLLARGG